MKLTYIFHSGFTIETEHCILVFDYWIDPADVMTRLLSGRKHIYVLSSHFHRDHFSRQVLKWRDQFPTHRYTYILSRDILRHGRAEAEEVDVWLGKGGYWEDQNIRVHAMGSNDCGVSWIVEVEGKTIFHAGDLNNWYAHLLPENQDENHRGPKDNRKNIDAEYEERRFLGELKEIAKVRTSFDLVMFPVDGRIGNGYTRGARQFLGRFKVGLFVPMHFVASGFASSWRMKIFTDMHEAKFWQIDREGASIEVM